MSRISSRLKRIFERSEVALGHTIPIRKTATGVWVPTPLQAIEAAFAAFEDLGLLGREAVPRLAIDAGSGDGRVPCVLASLDPRLRVYGVELDPVLFAQASTNVETLDLDAKAVSDAGRVHFLAGDYCDTATYAAGGLDFGDTGLVLNYPDGNERRLARFISENGGDSTKLCLLTTDHEVVVGELELQSQRDLALAGELPWRLSIYGRT